MINERVGGDYFQQEPPRRTPYGVVLELLNDYMFERPSRTFLDPLFITGLVVLVAMIMARIRGPLLLLPVALLAWRLALGLWRLWRQVSDDVALLRRGLVLRAHVLKLRPHRAITGEIDGALLDCAIPVAERRTYVGSIWLSDAVEAQRLLRQGRIEVVCLPRVPGTWRMIEKVDADVRYERMGPQQSIPQDV